MSCPFNVIDVNRNVLEAVNLIKDKGSKSIIITNNGKPVGILTDRDILFKVVARGRSAQDVRLDEVMSSPIITVSAETSFKDACEKMKAYKLRRLLVVENDKPVGLFTMKTGMCSTHVYRLTDKSIPGSWLHKHIHEVTEEALEHCEEKI